MHRESVTQALLGTALLFNTVFEMPNNMSFTGQMFSVGLISYMIFCCIEKVRRWEILMKKKSTRRQPKVDWKNIMILNYIGKWQRCKEIRINDFLF